MRSLARSLARTPTIALATIATIALGVGATTAMFSVIYPVLWRPLPYRNPDRLVMVWERWRVDQDLKGVDPAVAARLGERSPTITTVLPVWRTNNHVFEDIAGFSLLRATVSGGNEPERVDALAASSSLFTVLGVSPALGRAFTPQEDAGDDVAILSDALFRRRFGADPGVLGKMIGVDGVPHTIVGVMARDFEFTGPRIGADPELFVPIPHTFRDDRKWSLVMTVARLKPDATLASAQADMSAVLRHMADTNRRYRSRDANVTSLRSEVAHDSKLALLILFGATACVLLIGCVNIANLLLVRAADRSREFAIRTALGAGRWRLTREVVAESIVLSCAGGVAGLGLAFWGTAALLSAVPRDLLPRGGGGRPDGVVFAFALALSMTVGLVTALAPAWLTVRRDRRGALNRALMDTSRSTTGGRGQSFARRAFVTVQVTITLTLLVSAGLLAESYVQLTRVDLGVNTQHVLTFGLSLPQARYKSPESIIALWNALLARLEPLPGVEAAGLTNSLPVDATMLSSMSVAAEGQAQSEQRETVDVRSVTPGFFRAAGIRTAYGRVLTPDDARSKVIVVNRVLVRRFWPSAPPRGPEPLGRRLKVGDDWCTIVGVVEDVKYSGPDRRAEQEVYVPVAFWPMAYVSVLLRTSGDPTRLVDPARQAVRAVDADLPIEDIRTMDTVVSASVASQRFRFLLIGLFAGLALALSAVGLYGVMSQSVAQRAREMGIRMALGASRSRIVGLVLTEAMALVAMGVGAGIAASAMATRVLTSFLFGVTLFDVRVYALVACVVAMVCALAAFSPARRAVQSDPIVVLRAE